MHQCQMSSVACLSRKAARVCDSAMAGNSSQTSHKCLRVSHAEMRVTAPPCKSGPAQKPCHADACELCYTLRGENARALLAFLCEVS